MKIKILLLGLLIVVNGYSQEYKCSYHKIHNYKAPETKAYHSDSLDVLHYNINLDITDFVGKTISGYTELKIVPKVSVINNVSLDLLALNIDSILVENNLVSSFSYNDTLINIPVNAITINDTFLVKIYYNGSPVTDPSNWGGFYFSADCAFNLGVGFQDNPHNYGRVWYPCIDDFEDRATYDFNIIVENGKTAVCCGTLIDTTHFSNNTVLYHWNLRNTIPTYLSSVAVREYLNLADTFSGILGQIPINLYVRPTDSLNAVNSFVNLKPTLQAFEDDFGPYKWERIGYVSVPFGSGAMEHATNIAYPDATINGNLTYETLYAHELSHHWFGNLVTCKTAEDMWLNEGWASYSEAIFKEKIYGNTAYKNYTRENHASVVRYTHITDGGYRAVSGIPHEYTYGSTVYDKGADIAKTMRGYLGDSIFFNSIQAYLDTFSFNSASSEDFRDFLSSHSGIDMTDFFEGWVFSPGFPHFSVDSFTVVNNGADFDVTVYAKQKLNGRTNFTNSNKVPISFVDDNWTFNDKTLEFSGETGMQVFTIPFNPKFILVDKEERLSDATTDEYMVIKNTGDYNFVNENAHIRVTSETDSSFIRIQHNWVAPDSLRTPIKGLLLSDYRYYNIDGILSQSNNSEIRFKYSNSSLDANLMTNFADSLVLFYRLNPSVDWQIISSVKEGTNNVGYLFSDTLMLGEYCMGMRDWVDNIDDNSLNNDNKSGLNIYPNPSKNNFNIEFDIDENSKLIYYDIIGKELHTDNIFPNQNSITWSPKSKEKGVYIVKLYQGELCLGTKKIIFE